MKGAEASERWRIASKKKGKGITVDNNFESDSRGSPDLGRYESLAWCLAEEHLAEEEALEVPTTELVSCLALEEASSRRQASVEGPGAEVLLWLQRDALTAFRSGIPTSSTAEEASRSRPRRGGCCRRCSCLPPSRWHGDSGAERPPPVDGGLGSGGASPPPGGSRMGYPCIS